MVGNVDVDEVEGEKEGVNAVVGEDPEGKVHVGTDTVAGEDPEGHGVEENVAKRGYKVRLNHSMRKVLLMLTLTVMDIVIQIGMVIWNVILKVHPVEKVGTQHKSQLIQIMMTD